MIEVLHFVFSNFWIWLGSLIMLSVIVEGVADIIGYLFHRND